MIIIKECAVYDGCGMLGLGKVNLHIVVSYMTGNRPSSLVLESLLFVLDRLLFFMVLLLST